MSPRTKAQIEQIREASIDRIFQASLELFATHGYEATSISQIADRAGISKGLIYNYFDSKIALLKGMLQNLGKMESELMEGVANEDPRVFLRNLLQAYFTELKKRKEIWKMIASLSFQIDKFDFVHEQALVKLCAYLDLLEDLLGRLGHPNPKGEAKLLAALFDGIGMHYIILDQDYPLEEVEEYIIEKYCKTAPLVN